MSNNNPFDQYEENPFEDAAVLEAAQEPSMEESSKSSSKKSKKTKDDEEFGEGAGLFKGQSSSSSSSPPAYAPPAVAPKVAPAVSLSPQEKQRQEELERKEEELRRREAELQRQATQAQGGAKVNNWPICYPWIFHSIPDEIPVESQKFMRSMYYSWIATGICLGINIIGCLCILIAGKGGKDFGFSIMYFLFIIPLSFYLWYRPVYNAYMKDSSFYFLLYFFFGGFHILFELYMIFGIPDAGSAGFINTIDLYGTKDADGKRHYGEAAICTISLIIWILMCCVHIYLFRIVYVTWRSRGHTFQEARNQAISDAARSKQGREVFSAAAQGAFQGATSNP